jgi:hypothetical protein
MLQKFHTTSITASSAGTQASATPVTAVHNRVDSAAAGASVLLPAALPGHVLEVNNDSGSAIAVFPSANESIAPNQENTSVSIASKGLLGFYCQEQGRWQTVTRI